MAERGVFLTVEGGEGAGKSYQARLLVENLKAAGIPAILTREPGHDKVSHKIREVLLSSSCSSCSEKNKGNGKCSSCSSEEEERIDPLAEMFLFQAARAQHIAKVIAPALSEGKVVVCDRYIDSTMAYQGYGGGVSLEMIDGVIRNAFAAYRPDRTYLLHVPLEIGFQRKNGDALDRMELKGREFHRRVEAGFLELSRKEPLRFQVIDAMLSKEEVECRIWADAFCFVQKRI